MLVPFVSSHHPRLLAMASPSIPSQCIRDQTPSAAPFQELDLVAINTLSLAAANAALVYMVSPDRSFGAPHKMSWQKFLHGLPNNVFDACAPSPTSD